MTSITSKRLMIAAAAFLAFAGTAAFAQHKKTPAESLAFAKKVANANTFAIQSSQLAQDRAQSGDLKDYAQKVIADHTKLGEDFKSTLQAAGITPPPDRLNVKQKLALAKLRRAHGAAFDRAYLTAQLGGHKQAVALIRNYAKGGRNPQLKELAQKALPTEEQHLATATELSKQLLAGSPGQSGVGSRAIGPPAKQEKKR